MSNGFDVVGRWSEPWKSLTQKPPNPTFRTDMANPRHAFTTTPQPIRLCINELGTHPSRLDNRYPKTTFFWLHIPIWRPSFLFRRQHQPKSRLSTMTVDERLPSYIRQEEEEEEPSEEQQEQPGEDVIPLQRCPHLYIKYTPEKGRVIFQPKSVNCHHHYAKKKSKTTCTPTQNSSPLETLEG